MKHKPRRSVATTPPVPLARPKPTKQKAPALPVSAQLIILGARLANLERSLGISPPSTPSTSTPAAPPEHVQRLERDLRAAGVTDPKRLAAARKRATALSASTTKPAKSTGAPPFDATDARIVSLKRMLGQARLPEKTIAAACRRHWQRLHGAL